MAEHLKMHSLNKIDENTAKIAQLFPNCVTEAKDENGETVHKVDFNMLKQELSSSLVEGREERYQFTWPDKKQAILTANAPINKTLRPCREESVDFDNTENLYIEGDNLEVLKLLQETYLGKIKMIYIDPPYNTGNDFVYEDNFAQDANEYMSNSGQTDEEGNRLVANTESNGRFHTDWLNMIYPRLKLAKDLLTEDGVLFVSISDAEVDNLKKMLDEIFGAQNYCGDILWNSTKSVTNTALISVSHTYNFIYFKNMNYFVEHRDEFRLPDDGEGFENPDNDPRGPWKADPFQVGGWRPNQQYEIKNPNTGVVYKPNPGCSWKNDLEHFKELVKDNRIVYGKTGDSGPQRKRFLFEATERGKVPKTWWDDVETTTNGTQLVKKLFDNIGVFSNPKPVGLIKKLLQLGSNRDSIILDFFSGSGTTAHAVMELNAENQGTRKYILVQVPEECADGSLAKEAGYKTIPEIGKERIRRAGKKIKEDAGLNGQNLDIGFRVLKCDSSNMEDVYYTPDHLDKQDLFKSNVKQDRTAEDLLFQVMLDLGIMLSSKIETKKIDGKTVYYVEGNYLVVCFDEDVTEDTITKIAKEKPYYFVIRDSSMTNDSVSTNFEQIFKTFSPDTICNIL